jgi:hypothetical protein
MDISQLTKIVSKVMKRYPFVKKGNNWYYTSEECISLFNMQKSMYSSSYYLNISSLIKALEDTNISFPKEDECHLRTSLPFKDNNNDISLFFDLEKEINDKDRESGIEMVLIKCVIHRIYQISTIKGIKQFCVNNPVVVNSMNIKAKNFLKLPISYP